MGMYISEVTGLFAEEAVVACFNIGHRREQKRLSRTNTACPFEGWFPRASFGGYEVYSIAVDIPHCSDPEEKSQVVFLGTADVTMR
jgi:hypothetical protein